MGCGLYISLLIDRIRIQYIAHAVQLYITKYRIREKMSVVNGSYLIARSLRDEGAEQLFYLMGGPNYEIVNNSEDMGIRCIDFRHEQAAAMAAHAWARVTGKPGVTTAASGPGTLNLLTGHYNAFVDMAPMVTLGGAGPIENIGRGGFQEVDQAGIFSPVSKAVILPSNPKRLPEHVSEAFRLASSGRQGPVYLDCPEDVLYAELDDADAPAPSRPVNKAAPAGDVNLIRSAIRMLADARSPLLLTGGGAFWSKAWDAMREFVERTGIPFYTTPMSRGLIEEDHPFCFAGARSRAFAETDLVLVIGTRFNWVMSFGRRINYSAKIIQVDIHQEEIGKNRSADIAIYGDARAVLEQMNTELSRSASIEPDKFSQWRDLLRRIDAERRERVSHLENSPSVPIHPLRLCKDLRDVMGRKTILTVDGNEILHYGRQSIPVYAPGTRINSGPTGCMGVGLPYAIGAKVAMPAAQVVALHGDGSLGMNIQEFDTAVRYKLPIVVVVSNNEGWTARVEGVRKPGRELGYLRFDLIAEAMGGYGENVEDPEEIRPALERAFSSGLPAIVNVHTDPEARALSRFVGSRME